MTQDTRKGVGSGSTSSRNRDSSSGSSVDQPTGQRNKDKRERDVPSTKIVIRRLPPSMTMDIFVDQISPVPDNDYMYFVKADMSLGQFAFSRAYINFVNQDDIFVFKDKFDGYVFVDRKGNEFPAIVEFAPFQKIPKKKAKKKDSKCGTIEQDPDYIAFLEGLNNPEEVSLPSAEFHLEEIESRERGLRANNGVPLMTTPLIEYLKLKKAEKLRIREEKREERKRRELEKKRLKEDDRRRRKAEKDKDKDRDKSKDPKTKEVRDKEGRLTEDKSRGNHPVKLLKNPDRENHKRATKEIGDRESVGDESAYPVDQHTPDSQQQVSGGGGGVAATATSSSTGNRGERPRRDGEAVRPARFATTGPPGAREREWEAERRRRQDEERQRKQREKRERTRFKKGRDEQQQPTTVTTNVTGKTGGVKSRPNSVSSSAADASGQNSSTASSSATENDRARGKPSSSRGEWHARSSASTSNTKTDGGAAASYQQPFVGRGHERSAGGGGKSYEKSRESMAKARGGGRRGGGGGGGGGSVESDARTAGDDSEMLPTGDNKRSSDLAKEESLEQRHEDESDPREHRHHHHHHHHHHLDHGHDDEEKGRGRDTTGSSHQPRNRRERHGDPRPERRIRNKDRPSIELYRPGMSRRLSLQRNPKDSPSSSSSPSPTAQMLGRQSRDVGGDNEQAEHTNHHELMVDDGEASGRKTREQDHADRGRAESPASNSNHET